MSIYQYRNFKMDIVVNQNFINFIKCISIDNYVLNFHPLNKI